MISTWKRSSLITSARVMIMPLIGGSTLRLHARGNCRTISPLDSPARRLWVTDLAVAFSALPPAAPPQLVLVVVLFDHTRPRTPAHASIDLKRRTGRKPLTLPRSLLDCLAGRFDRQDKRNECSGCCFKGSGRRCRCAYSA